MRVLKEDAFKTLSFEFKEENINEIKKYPGCR